MPSPEDLERETLRNYLTLVAASIRPRSLAAKLSFSDLVQDTLVRAYQHLDEYRGDSDEEFRGWLRGILRHVTLDWVRWFARGKRDVGLERSLQSQIDASSARLEATLTSPQPDPAAAPQADEELHRLAEAMPGLPKDQRLAVELHYIEGLKYAEVAERLGVTVGAVSGLIRRGLARLRTALGDDGETP